MRTLIIGVLGISALYSQTVSKQIPTLSVCELMAHRAEYSGQMVTVRGTVQGGDGAWLVASQDCEYRLITKGVEWKNIIYLAYPDNSPATPGYQDYQADFKVDWKAFRKAEAEAVRAGYDPLVDREIASYVGLFRTYQDLGSRVTPKLPGALKLGFGPLGEAPALLLIQSVKDLVVVHGGRDNVPRGGGR